MRGRGNEHSRRCLASEPISAVPDEDLLCSGCHTCVGVCPYGAIEYDEKTGHSRIISAVCKACGCCVAACPAGAIKARHFTDEQIYAQLEAVL